MSHITETSSATFGFATTRNQRVQVNNTLVRRDGAHGAGASRTKTTHTCVSVISRETRRRQRQKGALILQCGMNAGFAPGATALPAFKLSPTGLQFAFDESRLAIRKKILLNGCAD
jgi:hypothetical protein